MNTHSKGGSRVHSLFVKGLATILREPSRGFEIANEIAKTSEEIGFKEGKLLETSMLAFTHFQLNQLDTSMFMLLEVIPKLEEHFPNTFYLGIAYNYEGRTYSRLNSLLKAGEKFEIASKVFLRLDSISHYCMALNNYGTIEGMRGNHMEALAAFLEVVKQSTKNKIAANFKSSALSNISYMYELENQMDKALEYAFKGLKIDVEIGNSRAIAESYSLIGTIYTKMDYLDSALFYYQKVATVGGEGNVRLMPIKRRAISNISKVFAKQGYVNKAIHLLKTEGIDKSNENTYLAEAVNLQLANYHLELNDIDSAVFFAKESLQIANNEKIKLGIRDAAKTLTDIYLELGDYKSAYEFFDMYHMYNDSVYNESSNRKFSNLRIEIETLEKQAEIENLKKEKRITALNTRIIISSTIVALAIVIVGFWIYRKNNLLKEKELRSELNYKQNQLTGHTLNMLHKNNGFSEIENEVLNMRKKGEPNYQKILNIVQRNRAEEKDWNNFKNYFGQVHENFETKLTTRFPNLSVGDFRLATLVKMNLTNSEIASLLFIESKSVRMSKYRLKKKLGLNEEDNLSHFLSTI